MYRPFKRNIFSLGPSYDVQSWIMVKHIVETSGESAPRIAVIFQDDDYGRDGLKGLHEAVEAYGIELVAEEGYKRGAIDFSSQVLNIKSKHPTHVLLCTAPREAAAILKKAHQTGLNAQFIGGGPVSDTKVIELAGSASENLLVISTLDLCAKTPSTQVQAYRAVINKYTPDREATYLHALGYTIGQVLTEGLGRAGPDLTRDKLVKALETLKQFETLASTFTYGPSTRGGTFERAFVLRAVPEEGRFERVSDWITHAPKKELARKGSSSNPQG